MNLSKKLRSEIFNFILNKEGAFSFATLNEDGFLPFLSEIWDLESMPSEDTRYNNAYRDIFQHTVNNNDWEVEYLFKERLKLLDDNEKFSRFLETFISPKYRQNADEAFTYFVELNEILKKEKTTLVVIGYDDEARPTFSLQKLEGLDHPADLPKNTIPFYVVAHPGYTRNRFREFDLPGSMPCFSLIPDNWDDFGHKTSYAVHYHDDSGRIEVGYLKIASANTNYTLSVLPEEFTILDDSFCSLGQEFDYYINLSKILGKRLDSVLFALKDCSFFPDIADEFDQKMVFKKSLLRNDEAERVYRQVKHQLKGIDPKKLYQFTYHFTPKYSSDSINIDFLFNAVDPIPNRIYALIGKNGTGKTQLITSLPLQIANDQSS